MDHDYIKSYGFEDLSPTSFKKYTEKLYKRSGNRYNKCQTETEQYERWKCIMGDTNIFTDIFNMVIGKGDINNIDQVEEQRSYVLVAHFQNPIAQFV